MIRNKISIERQLDEKLYQFLIPEGGNWDEVLIFAQQIYNHAKEKINDIKAKEEEEKKIV